jgi:hypothetical protein
LEDWCGPVAAWLTGKRIRENCSHTENMVNAASPFRTSLTGRNTIRRSFASSGAFCRATTLLYGPPGSDARRSACHSGPTRKAACRSMGERNREVFGLFRRTILAGQRHYPGPIRMHPGAEREAPAVAVNFCELADYQHQLVRQALRDREWKWSPATIRCATAWHCMIVPAAATVFPVSPTPTTHKAIANNRRRLPAPPCTAPTSSLGR